MTQLRLLAAPEDRPPGPGAPGKRRLAPGAPESPGTVPLDLALLLRREEPAVWWNEKDQVSWAPVAWTAAAGLFLIGLVSALAPELWIQPWRSLLWPFLVPLSPAALVLLRELMSRRALMVTDTSIVDIPVWGEPDRIAFRNVRSVRRDPLTGGVILHGEKHRVRIPPSLMDDCRTAIASQTRHQLKTTPPDDPLHWLP